MMRIHKLSIVWLVLTCLAPVALGELVENPNYHTWKNCAVGTIVKHDVSQTADGQTMNAVSCATLQQLTDEKAIVGNSLTLVVSGKESTTPQPNTEFKKMAERDLKEPSTVDAAKLANAPVEQIVVPGGTFQTKVVAIDDAKLGVTGKIWFNEDVPNGMVKMELHFSKPKQDITAQLILITPAKKN